MASGAASQDVDHRIIPNWSASILLLRNRNVAETMHDPRKMVIVCFFIGAVVVAFLNTTASSVPDALRITAVKVLVPASNLLVNIAMPVIFWFATIGAGKRAGFWGTFYSGLAHIIMGNAVHGLVLGILVGKGIDENGWSTVVKIMFTAIVCLFTLIYSKRIFPRF